MAVSLSPIAGAAGQLFDNNGVPLAGGLIYTYSAGTTTPLATYTSSTGVTAHTNPIVLDSAGRVPGGEIWVTKDSSYKFVIYTSTNVLIGSYDNLIGPTFISDTLANTSDPAQGDALVGFRQSYVFGNLTNSVGKTLHVKMQEFLNVKDFGAVGDGVTDDTAAITSAIAASAALGKELVFATGIYIVSSTITVNGEALIFTGEGEQPYRASQYASKAGVILFFTGTTGNPIFSFPTQTANVGQSAGHVIRGLSFVGGHVEFNAYQTWNLVESCGFLSRTWGWSIGSQVEQSDLATLQAITAGVLTVNIDGTSRTLSGIDLSTATSFDDVADLVDVVGRTAAPYLRCQFTNGKFVIKAGTSSLSVVSGNLMTAMRLGAATYSGSKMCTYGINFATTNFNSLVEKCSFWDIDGNSVFIGDNNGNTSIYHSFFSNRATGIVEGVISTKHHMVVIKSSGVNNVIHHCDFEPMIAASMVKTESTNTVTIENCYLELPDVLATDVTTFFEIGEDLGTGSFFTSRAVNIQNNFMNCKAKTSRAINIVSCDRGVWISGNEILNFQYPVFVNTTAGSVAGQICYDGIQNKDTQVISITGTTTAGSAVVTAVSSTALLEVGMTVTGTTLPANSYIASIDSSTQFTLVSGTGVTAGVGTALTAFALRSILGGAAEKVDTRGSVPVSCTMAFVPQTGSFTSVTYDADTAFYYVRNGNTMYLQGYVLTDAITVGTAADNLTLAPLPVDKQDLPGPDSAFVGITSMSNWQSDYPCFGTVNTSTISLRKRATSNGVDSPMQVSDLKITANANGMTFSTQYICVENT